ncbi:conserved Plasmodium protein, unknown function [Plasmodium ovale wallikeri]|uniref:CKK domain-containing protein n=1 Tax=Plasmodium ovale wallikeri TaxID=864142 RepID=A0A1A8ZC83_PLAOA|nr:conserved Plasmodium protein, unknown function [Plasmodium ovale wallikeri]SBT42008.1 conserved Plasmodium protein, unknown function [Plasmodium ovale wallikeri]
MNETDETDENCKICENCKTGNRDNRNNGDNSAGIAKNCSSRIKGRLPCANGTKKDIPFYVNYEILLKKYKQEKNYVDLNLEINYNLEEIMENKDNIKKCLLSDNVANTDNPYTSKNNEYQMKNEKYYHDDRYYADLRNEREDCGITSDVGGSGECIAGAEDSDMRKQHENKIEGRENTYYGDEYSDQGYSSDSYHSYCSDVSENSSKNEKTKCMNFSQRITYDNNLLNNFGSLEREIDYSEGINKNKKQGDKNYIKYKLNTEQGRKSNRQNSPFYNSEHKNAPHSLYNKCRSAHVHPFTTSNTQVNVNFDRNNSSIKSRKIEEEILNKYEKIIKIMKYLRRIKTKYPEIETIVSILSSHVKNVTFNCEKMFDSRYELNEVVFKNPGIEKDDHSNPCNDKNLPLHQKQFFSTERHYLRDHSELPDDTRRDSRYMLHQLSKNRPFHIRTDGLYEHVMKKNPDALNANGERYNRGKYEKVYNNLGNIRRGTDKRNETKMNSTGYTEYAEGNIHNCEKEKNKLKYHDNKAGKQNTQNDFPNSKNECANRDINICNNYDDDNMYKSSSYYIDMKDKYEEALKNNIYTIDKNDGRDRNKQSKKKNENIFYANKAINKITDYHKNSMFAKAKEDDILPKKEALTGNNDITYKYNNKKNELIDTYLRVHESKKGDLKNIANYDTWDNRKKFMHKRICTPSDALNIDYLNILDLKNKNNTPNLFLEDESSLNALNLEGAHIPQKNSISKNEKCTNECIDMTKIDKKTYVLYHDVNRESNSISNRDSVIHALKHSLLNKPQNVTALQNFLFKIDVEMVEYKNFVLLITRNVKKLHLEALYGLNDFSVFEKVYGKKVAPRFLVSRKVKIFYKYDTFYQRFKELTNVRDFSGITDAVELI